MKTCINRHISLMLRIGTEAANGYEKVDAGMLRGFGEVWVLVGRFSTDYLIYNRYDLEAYNGRQVS